MIAINGNLAANPPGNFNAAVQTATAEPTAAQQRRQTPAVAESSVTLSAAAREAAGQIELPRAPPAAAPAAANAAAANATAAPATAAGSAVEEATDAAAEAADNAAREAAREARRPADSAADGQAAADRRAADPPQQRGEAASAPAPGGNRAALRAYAEVASTAVTEVASATNQLNAAAAAER